jgi:hypothetical protein
MAGISGKPIKNRQYRTGCRVLDRNDETVHAAMLESIERHGEPAVADVLIIRVQLRRCPIAVAVGLSLVSDDHGGKVSAFSHQPSAVSRMYLVARYLVPGP